MVFMTVLSGVLRDEPLEKWWREVGDKPKQYSCKGNCQGKKFMQRGRQRSCWRKGPIVIVNCKICQSAYKKYRSILAFQKFKILQTAKIPLLPTAVFRLPLMRRNELSRAYCKRELFLIFLTDLFNESRKSEENQLQADVCRLDII